MQECCLYVCEYESTCCTLRKFYGSRIPSTYKMNSSTFLVVHQRLDYDQNAAIGITLCH